MLTPIKTPLCNVDFIKPANWNEEKDGPCASLPAHYDPNREHVFTWWRLTWRDRLRVLFGVPVRLVIAGRMPPVTLSVEKN